MPSQNPSTDVSIFQFESHTVRAFIDAFGAAWTIGTDAGRALHYQNIADTLKRLDDDEKGIFSIYTLGGRQEVWCINESGLYSLILGSRKPEAKKFKRWITHEVLPSLRQKGSYTLPGDKPELPAIVIPSWQPRTNITLMQLKVFAFFYTPPHLWTTASDVALATRIGPRQIRDFCKYFVDSKLCERMQGKVMVYRWSLTAEVDNPAFLHELLTARHTLPLDVQQSEIPLWERENDPRQWQYPYSR